MIPEHCFAVDAGGSTITLSNEHTECRWLSYEQAFSLLKWDSNRTALWELNERLKSTPNQISHRTVDPRRVNVRLGRAFGKERH